MSITKFKSSVSNRVAAGAVGITMALALLGSAVPAQAAALTANQVSAIVTLLQSFGADATTIANVQASLTGGTTTTTTTTSSTGSCATWTRSLTVGSNGADVMALQKFLNANGVMVAASGAPGSMGMETSHFGPATRAAVAKFQMMHSISPAVGYFGPITMASVNSMCTSGTTTTGTTTTTTGPLTGNGYLSNLTSLGDITSNLHEGDSLTAVAGVSAQATGGDVQIQRVQVTFDMTSTSGSINIDRYVSSIQLWDGNTKLASLNPSTDGSLSSKIWTFRFSGLSDVVKSGQTANLHVKVVPLTSIGINENGQTVTAKMDTSAIQATGADGISDTYGATVSQGFSVAAATTGTLTVSVAADNQPANQVAVGSSTTSGVKLLNFTMKAKNSNIKITDLNATFTTSDNNLSDVVNTVYLMQGSNVIASKTLSTGSSGAVTFNNINQTISQDQTVEYTLAADLKGDQSYVDGTTLYASTTVSNWTVQDGQGNSVTPSAAASGNTMTLTATGISIAAAGSASCTQPSAGGFAGALDTTTCSIPFSVTAGDSAVYIKNQTTLDSSPSATPASNTGVNFATTTSSTQGTATASTTFSSGSITAGSVGGQTPSQDTSTAYYIPANTTRTFTLTVPVSASTGNTAGTLLGVALQLVGINYSPTSTFSTTFYTSNLSSFQTSPMVYIEKH